MCLLLAVPPQDKTIFTVKNELKKLFLTYCRLWKLLSKIVPIVTELKVNRLWFSVWGGLWWVQWKVVFVCFLIQGVCYHPFRCSKALTAPRFSAMLQSVGVTRLRWHLWMSTMRWVHSISTMSCMTLWSYLPLHPISLSSIQSLSSSSKKILCF